jgi:hypothetical protein
MLDLAVLEFNLIACSDAARCGNERLRDHLGDFGA